MWNDKKQETEPCLLWENYFTITAENKYVIWKFNQQIRKEFIEKMESCNYLHQFIKTKTKKLVRKKYCP